MSNYFSYFPTIEHDLKNDNTNIVTVKNILKRFKISDASLSNIQTYYDYNIQDGDRPDVIAQKYYGNEDYAWLVLFSNNIVDPIKEWPLFGTDFTNYVKSKYGSIELANTTTKKRYKVLSAAFKKIDGTVIPKRRVEIDETTYNTLSEADKEIQTAYEYEVEVNDNNRNIRLIDSVYLMDIQDQVEQILRSTV